MNSYSIEEGPDCVIKDWRSLLLIDVFVAQKIDKVARIHPVKSIEQHVKSILQMNQLTLLNVHWMKNY